MSRHQEQLACSIARHHFGSIVGEVVRLLCLQPGSSVLAILVGSEVFFSKRYTAVKGGQTCNLPTAERARLIRDALAVLIQHDLVYAIEIPGHSQSKPNVKGVLAAPFEYHLFLEKLLCRSRIPFYLGFARRRYGSIGETALRVVFERGRLTPHMMFITALDVALQKLSLTVQDAEACLTDMARSGLLHWSCRRPSKRSQFGHGTEDANARVGEKRARVINGSDADDNDDSSSDSDDGDDGRIDIGSRGVRRKVGAPNRDNDTDVWTACYWHLNREFRNECCVKVVQTRFHGEAEIACSVLRIGLQLALEEEDCTHPSEDFETTDILIEDIQKLLEAKDGTLSASTFWEAIQFLVSQTPSFILPIPESAPTKLRFVPGRLIAEARQKTLEELIATRYQPAGRRIFQALAIEGGMEEKMLADKCMMPLKLVRSLIYRLFEDELVGLQEVPRSHDQQRSNNWYYLWKVNILAALRNTLEIMYKTSCNLFLRLESLELEKGSDEDIRRAKAQECLLIGSILRLDQSIMVMRDFGPLTASYFPARYTIIDGPVGLIKRRQR